MPDPAAKKYSWRGMGALRPPPYHPGKPDQAIAPCSRARRCPRMPLLFTSKSMSTPFHLTRHVALTSLVPFAVVAAALIHFTPMGIEAGLLVVLYVLLLTLVRRAQTTIEREAKGSDATRQRLAHLEKMTTLGQMVAGVAHQLNTPLAFSKNNVIMALQALDQLEGAVHRQIRHASYLTEPAPDDPDTALDPLTADRLTRDLAAAMLEMREAREMLSDVLMGMEQVNELVDNLRSFARLDRAPTAAVDLNTALGSVCYIARTVISTKVQLERDFQPLPSIRCNVSQLNQVFLNLIKNAAQAIRRSGTITVSTRADERHITVCIRDDGSGIAANVLPHIFEPYFTTKPDGEGTGLGLSIARNIVREHGGDIEVSSELELGTEFRVRLPLDRAA